MTYFGRFLLGGSDAEQWSDDRKKNFFINDSVGLSMCDGSIETVRLDFVAKLQKYTSFAYSWSTSHERVQNLRHFCARVIAFSQRLRRF